MSSWICLTGGIDNMIEIDRVHDVSLILDVETLNQVYLKDMNFHRCLLNDLDFVSAILINIDFRSAEMNNSKFSFTKFDKSKLIMVEAKNSIFDKCSFKESLLLHSDFSDSSFKFADLSEGIINDVIFVRCDLRGANMSCSGLETCVLNGAIYDQSTIWNENFNAMEHGAIMLE